LSSTDAENSGKKSGHANLLPGGVIGNKGGTGRPKSEVRAACADSFDARIPKLQEIADNKEGKYSASDVLKALDLLGKYGGLQQVDQTSDDKPIQTTVINFGEMSVDEREKMLENLPE